MFGITSPPSPLCIVLELCSLGSLNKLLKSQQIEITSTFQIEILLGIARGVSHLHKHNIVHRDLASRNILLSSYDIGGVKVSDFGLARSLGLLEIGETKSLIGPIKWMSPESISLKKYSRESDSWSFGVVIYEVVSGKAPFEGLTNLQVMQGVVKDRATVTPPINCLNCLSKLIQDCCNYSPENRPSFQLICNTLEKEWKK